jgi:hypothetical protein
MTYKAPNPLRAILSVDNFIYAAEPMMGAFFRF